MQPLENRSSHWTIAVADHGYLVGLLILTVFHFILSAHVPPAEDELYYWTWAKELSSSYFDHPPMVAWLIAGSTKLFGNGLFGIRFFSCVASLLILLALKPLCGRTQILSLVIFTPLFLLGSILMTPDTPLFFFWTAYLFWIIRLNRRLSDWSDDPVTRVYHRTPIGLMDWVIAGVLLGLGGLSKYTMALGWVATFVTFLTRYPFRAWIMGFTVHSVASLLVLFPVLWFNLTHNFVSFQFQWLNSVKGDGFQFFHVTELIGSQILLVGAMPLLALPWLFVRRQELSEDHRLHPCFYFFVIPFLFFIFQSFRGKVEANWPLFCYLSFWPLGQRLVDRSSFREVSRTLLFISFVIPIFISFALLTHLVKPLQLIKPEKDRMTRLTEQYRMTRSAAQDVKADLMADGRAAPLFLPTYQWTAYFKYFGIESEQLSPLGRQSQYTMQAHKPCEYDSVYFFGESADPLKEAFFSCFNSARELKQYPLTVRGVTITTYRLIKFHK